MPNYIYQSSTRGNGNIEEGFGFSNGSMPYIPQQYALPIHQAGSRRDSSDTAYDSGDQTPRAENTLRRKTPNGTLNAGYDGAIDDANPYKHQLIPMSENNAVQYAQAPSGNLKRTFFQHQQLQNVGVDGWNASNGMWNGSQYPQVQSSFPVMDSMLSQMPLHPYQQFYSHTVPSVLQPSFQYLGPTAPGLQGSGLYGPYWHDGTFIPYRPAATRDPRFYHHNAANWYNSATPTQFATPAAGWQQNVPVQAQWNSIQGAQPFANVGVASQTTDLRHQFTPYGDITPTQVQHQSYGPVSGSTPSMYALNNVSHMSDGSMPSIVPDLDSEFGPSSPNAKQRDRTFAWALQRYRELLVFIHHTRRQQQQHRHAQGQRHVPQRPSFYPKPPKPSFSGTSLQMRRHRPDIGADGRSNSDFQGRSRPVVGESRNSDSELEMNKVRPSSIWSPSGIHFQENEYQRRASEQSQRPYPTWSQPSQQDVDKFRTLRRSSGSSVQSIMTPMPNEDSPPARAAVALSLVTKLCQDTEWQWTDGMHLGGCLAYGLGNYQKALRWYKKVLEMDPKHLEAISNLAATFLALGRRSEAEQHWMKVVKAAPNHFEAVEHLIGMLCNDHRSRDAVHIIEYVERSLRLPISPDSLKVPYRHSECSSSTASRSPCISEVSDRISFDFDVEDPLSLDWRDTPGSSEPGFGSSGFAIPGCDNGRILALIHAKGNMLYGLGDNAGAARAFEDAVLIAAGRRFNGIQGLVEHILSVVLFGIRQGDPNSHQRSKNTDPVLLTPDQALATGKLCFPTYQGELPGLQHLPSGPHSLARKAVMSTTSNSLLSLAKIFQDGMSNASRAVGVTPLASGVRDILALYYLSLSLQPSPSTANNVGILLASVQQTIASSQSHQKLNIPGVVPGSGVALALQYYNYGLQLDQHHAHLYTNLGSLLKDIGQLDAAINMYERAVKCDARFDIALANLANAVKDKGKITDAIGYYKRAVEVNPDFAEAVCGLANALNSVCSWHSRGGIAEDGGRRDRWHVDANGMLLDASQDGAKSTGWIIRVVDIVE